MPAPTPTPDTVELPPSITDELGDLGRALLDLEDPILRLAILRAVERRLEAVLGTVRTLAIADARGERHTFRVIGEAYGVSEQRAHQLSRSTEPLEDITQ